MGLFTKRRTLDYQGFAKYTEEYNRHAQTQDVQRAQSLSNASHAAAAAALQKHQKQQVPAGAVRGNVLQKRPVARANSLGGNYQRANSLQSYTYTPKPSYVTGPVLQHLPQKQQRTQSLRANSLAGSVRLGGRRNFMLQPVFPEEDEYNYADADADYDDTEDVVVTTKTTKVLDAQGRTRSITTETVRQLPDGSNIIETKTTNILRQGSRVNSRANSLQGPAAASPQGHTYSLKKIEEDLMDFEYNYLDHAPPNSVRAPEPVYEDLEPPAAEKPFQSPVKPVVLSPARAENRTNSLTSGQSPRKLKSILKSSSSAANAAAAVLAVSSSENGHLNASKNGFEQQSSAESSNESNRRPMKLQPAPEIGPSHRHGSLTSAGNSIKFLDKVETIPYTYSDDNYAELANDDKHKKEQALQNNVDLYTKALQVATEKVYGSPRVAGNQFTQPSTTAAAATAAVSNSPKAEDSRLFAQKKSEKKLKTDEKINKLEASGISKNYVYTNHHKDFSVRSMRDSGLERHSSRKERAKEEKKQIKEEEREHAERLKAAEKQMKEEEQENAERLKAAEKQKKQEEKEAKKREKNPFSLFKRNKRRSSVSGSSLGSLERKQSFSSQQNTPSSPVAKDIAKPASNGYLGGLSLPVHGEILETPAANPNGGGKDLSVSERQIAVNSPSLKAEQAQNSPNLKSQVASVPQVEPSKTVDAAKKPEDQLQLAKSRTFDDDDDDDEFVDVPDNIGDDTEKIVSSFSNLGNGNKAERSRAPVENLLQRPPIANEHETTNSKSLDSIKIPERGDLDRQPEVGLAPKESKVHDVPEASKHTFKLNSPEKLPTLVSDSRGNPKVLTNNDHQVVQPRDLSVHHSANELKDGETPKATGSEEHKINLETATLPEPSAELALVSRPLNETSPAKNAADHHQGSGSNGSDAIYNVAEPTHVNSEAPSGHHGSSESHPVLTEGEQQNVDIKTKAKKKTSRFKKVIEKYFITNYSR